MPSSRPYECPTCALLFRRSEHLHRHIRLHTGEKLYQCPCGDSFFRSDVLVQHLRKCDEGRDSQDKIPKRMPQKKVRTKRACDKCAQSKSKCDGQATCNRCSRQSLTCKYTREGPLDLYSAYSIARSEKSLIGLNDQRMVPAETSQSSPHEKRKAARSPSSAKSSHGQSSSCSEASPELFNTPQLQQEHTSIASSVCTDNQSHHLQLRQNSTSSFDLDSLCLDYASASSAEWEHHFNTSVPSEAFLPFFTMFQDQFLHDTQPSFYSPFSLEQIDPVEAKCTEIKDLLIGSEPLVTAAMISTYITRENLLYFIQLYGRDLRPHCPIIHAPTFNLMQTSPLLLLAIMLVGACYSKRVISPGHITKLAMRLLKLIEIQPHEIRMDILPLQTIQSSIIVCSLLFRSRSEIACEFVTSYFARNVSLIKRTGVFGSVDSVDYSYMTEESFDWQCWINQESLRRSLCQVLCQDIAGCIFQGSSPCISPLDLDIQMPCYESAWEAKTSAACLQQLQTLPQQIQISAAIQRLRQFPAAEEPLFEASGLGMLVLVTGLHYLLFQATKHDIMFAFDTSKSALAKHPSTIPHRPTDLDLCLQSGLSGPAIAALADKAATSDCFSTLKHVNNALNAWRTTWDLRFYRETQFENSTLFGYALPFWWLAKLYVFLHYHAALISRDSEFATPRVGSKGEGGKMTVQAKILRWFSKFCSQTHDIERELYDANEVSGIGCHD